MVYRECFVPTCKNDTKISPDKIFVRIREDLKEKWCREVKAEYFKVNTMFCCEDHLKPTEDLMSYYQCKLMKQEPKLKRTALLRNISHDDRTEGLSELKNILVQSPTSSKSLKKKYDDFDTSKASTRTLPGKSKYGTQYEDLAMPSTSTCSTLPIKVNSNEDSESGPSTSKRIRVQTPTEQNDNIVQHHILDIGNTTGPTSSPLSISTKDGESSITKIIIKTESSDTEIDIEETMLSETNTIADGENSDRNISIKMESRDTETGIEETGETTVFETNMTSIPMIHEDVVKAKKQDDMAFYKCNVCMRLVLGPRYTCVQCADYDICRSCETGGYHDQHYVLRIPPKQPESEIQERLDIIRRALDSISSTKPYKEFVKIEKVEDPLFVQDPLLEDTTCNLIPEQTDGDVPNEDDDDANDESYKPTESCDTAQDDVLDNSDSDSDYTPERSSWPIVKRTKLPVIMDKNLTPTNDDTSSLTCFEKNTVIKLYKHIESDADGIAECKIKEKVADIMQIPEKTVNDIIKIYKDSGQIYPLNVKIYPRVKKAKFSSSTIKKGKGILFRNMTSNESFFAARIRDYIISTFPAAVPDMKNVYRTVSKITGWEAKCLDRLFKLEENRQNLQD